MLAPPRRLLLSFVLLLLLPAVAVVWLGVWLIQKDRELESRQLLDRRVAAADRVTAALQKSIAVTERRVLSSPENSEFRPDDDVVVVVDSGGDLSAYPASRLLYYPSQLPALVPSSPEFATGDALQFERKDFASAARAFRQLADSAARPDTQAGALLRLAANLKQLHRQSEALAVYDELARIPAATANGLPADLVARRAKMILLGDTGQNSRAEVEARALRSDLLNARWAIDRGTFRAYLQETSARVPQAPDVANERLALADSIAWYFDEISAGRLPTDPGRRSLRLNDTETVVLWQRTGGRLVVFAAGPRFVAREWIAPLAVDQATSGARILLRSEAGEWNEAPPVGAITRTATESSLPWTIAVSTDDEAKTIQEFSTRRLLLAAGLSLLVVVVIAGGAFTLRAVSRELAVAQLQSDFVSAVSHEFRTPLTSLRQFTDLLSDAQEPSEEKRRVFHEAQGRATDRLQRLVESLLDFGRMEAGARPYQLRRMRAADFAQRVVADFRRDAAPQGFQIECSTAALAERCDIAADGNALTTALWNLLDNAVKYSGTGRTVSVEVSCTEGNVAIAVRDAGVGITRTERSRIFDKFVRGSASRDGEIEGTGIGLAMVRHIVSAHGGRVTVESEPGNGSTFTIGLPVVSSPALAQESDDLQVRSSGVEARS